jgi:RHS repeat-associated protein
MGMRRQMAGVFASLLLVTLVVVVSRPEPVVAGPPKAATAEPVVLERPDEQSALITARLTGKKVKITGASTETSQSWALPSGQIEAEVHSGPQRIPDGKGGWTQVDFTLQRLPDGSVGAKAHPYGLRLSGAAGAGEHDLVTLGSGDRTSSMGWSGPLPEPVVEGTKATYPDVRPDVDLVVEATRTGFEQFLVVKSRAGLSHVRSITLPMRSKGLRHAADGKGGLETRDASGRTVGRTPTPVMWDAQIGEKSGDHLRRTAVPTKVVARSAQHTDLVLAPNQSWLEDPATQFPVTIDPAVNWGSTFDTFVQSGEVNDQSASTDLKLGFEDDGTSSIARSFLTWPTSALAGKQVIDARVYLWNYHSWSCTAANWQVWTTGQATTATRFTSQPAWLFQEGVSNQTKGYTSSCNDGWVSAPATSFFQRAAAASAASAHMGLRAASSDEGNHLTWKRFHSKEAANDPYVKVTYQAPPTVTSKATVPSTACVTGTGRPYINTTTPQLRAQVTDGENSAVQAKFEWWSTTGSSTIGSATVGYAASGAWQSTTVPSGAFANGSSYKWRAQGYDGTAWGAWSTWCEFTVDTTAPSAAPTVTSTTYPERSATPTGYFSSAEPRPFTGGTTLVSLTGDDAVTSVSLPFAFTFYGQSYTSAWIDTNGQLDFVDPGGSHASDCQALPNPAAPNGGVNAYCDDLMVDASAGVYTATLGTAPARRFVVEWRNIHRYSGSPDDRFSISATLHEDTGEIVTNYSGIDPANTAESGDHALVGIENANGTAAEQYSNDEPILATDTAVVFRPGVLAPTSYTKSTTTQTYAGGTNTLALTGDDAIAQLVLPFPINFYGKIITTAFVDTNGILYFRWPGFSRNSCPTVPDAAPPNSGLYVFCDDLLIDASAAIRTSINGTAPDRTFTIEWYNALRYTDPTATDRINAAITLAENGTITFNYSGINSGDAEERGAAAVVGIENAAGTAGVLHSNRTAVLADNAAIVFTPTVVGGPTSTGGAGVPGTFTFGANGVGDVSAYQYGLNANPPDTTVNATAVGGGASTTITPTADGPQVLYVRSQDRAGNQSGTREYRFFAGPGGVTSPKPGDSTAAKFALTAVGHPASTGVTYQWRRADTDVWSNIPLANLTYAAGGTPVMTVPVITTGGGAYPKLNWDVEATLAAADTGLIARDGPLQVRAIFSGLSNGEAKPVKVMFDRNHASAASADIGPTSVNLITGNATVAQTDVSASAGTAGLSVSRSFNTRRPNAVGAMYGPGWVAGILVSEAEAPYTQLNVYNSLVQVGLPDGGTIGFTKRTATGTGATFDAEPGSEQMTLVYATNGDSYTLTDGPGNVVTFARQATDPVGQYMPATSTPAASDNTTTYAWEKVTVDGQAVVRPTRVLGPGPAGVTCGTLIRGCRALQFTYATSTTATGTDELTWGDYSGRIKEITYVAWDPDLTVPAMRTVVLARYAYDNAGRLRASWDPRLDWTDGSGTHHLWYRYAYDNDGILTTITPPGQQPWQFAYTTLPSDPGKGRLHKVSRSALAAGTAVETVVYKVPTYGAGAAYDLSGGQTARWRQIEPPVDATAIFPGTQIPTGDPATGTLPSSYERSTITYMDANGRTVNTVAPGGYTSTTWYDVSGNVVRELTAANRQRALDASGTDSADQESALAANLSNLYVYSADGVLTTTLGPEHDLVLDNGSVVRGRVYEELYYDEGAPSAGIPYDLVTTTISAVWYVNAAGTVALADKHTTKTEYDWTTERPIAQIVDPAGLNLKTRTSYDSDGKVIATTTPAGGSIDTTPSTRKTIYYSATPNAVYPECGNRAEWADLVCRTHPGGQAATGPELVATVTTYDLFGLPRVTTEKNSAGIQRTRTLTYDGAGRPYEATISGPGEPLDKRRNVYDAATGQMTRTQFINASSAVTAEIVRTYDTLGRLTAYTDADGNTSTTTYDLVSRPTATHDGKATQTFTYDGGSERRGLPTQVVDDQAGAITVEYDAAGNPATQNWPNGMVITLVSDEIAATTSVRYSYPSCGQSDCTLYYDTALSSGQNQWRQRNSTTSSQIYSYDRAARLTTADDNIGAAGCTRRVYGFNAASSRTSLTTYGPDAEGGCQDTTATSTNTWTYDTADRLTTTGTVYDTLGRTTAVPTVDTVAKAAAQTVEYHADDTVRQITENSTQTTYTADVVSNRIRAATAVTDGTSTTKTFHYNNDGDSPIWTEEGGWYTRMIGGPSGIAGIYTGAVAHVEWKITNLHGDFVATVTDPAAGVQVIHEPDEHGLPRGGVTLDQRYAYLGSAQRAADNPGGLITMGARLYNPATGRFLSVDPIYGGNANPYDYCSGDSVNCSDTSGQAADCRGSWYSANSDKTRSWRTWAGVFVISRTRVSVLQARCKLNTNDTWRLMIALDNGRNAAISAAIGILFGGLCAPLNAGAALACGLAGVFIGMWIGALIPGSYTTWYDRRCRGRGIQIRAAIGRIQVNETRIIPTWWGRPIYYNSSWSSKWITVPKLICR